MANQSITIVLRHDERTLTIVPKAGKPSRQPRMNTNTPDRGSDSRTDIAAATTLYA